MDGNRSGRATLNGFCQGLETANVDLTREQYVRLFKAIDTNGDRHITLADLRNTLQRPDAPGTPGGAEAGTRKGTGTPKNPFPVSARKAARRGEVKESHGGPRPFPPPRSYSGASSADDRQQLQSWLEFDLRRRGVGLSHVLQLMDGNRSGRATLNGFCQGLETANVDLTREQYVRLFKAIDTNGDRHVTLADLRNTLQRPADAPGTPGTARKRTIQDRPSSGQRRIGDDRDAREGGGGGGGEGSGEGSGEGGDGGGGGGVGSGGVVRGRSRRQQNRWSVGRAPLRGDGGGGPVVSHVNRERLEALRKELHHRHVTTGQLFSEMDAERHDAVSFHAFRRGLAMASVAVTASDTELHALFETFDTDGDQRVTYQEVLAALEGEFRDLPGRGTHTRNDDSSNSQTPSSSSIQTPPRNNSALTSHASPSSPQWGQDRPSSTSPSSWGTSLREYARLRFSHIHSHSAVAVERAKRHAEEMEKKEVENARLREENGSLLEQVQELKEEAEGLMDML
jgi:Ca2+-binding EF-hand superfamily protein